MRPVTVRSLLTGIAAVALVVLPASCGGDTARDASPETSASTIPASTTSTAPARIVDVRIDVPYADVPPGWTAATLDEYAPRGAAGAPLVLVFPGGGATKEQLQYADIARELAQRGAVAMVVGWRSTPPYERLADGASASAVVQDQARVRDEVACAVSFAVDRAPALGADPRRLVLIGHSAGASMAATVSLLPHGDLEGCAAPTTAWTPEALVLWDGDWASTDLGLDVFGADLTTIMRSYTPWPQLDAVSPSAMRLEFVVTVNSVSFMTMEATPTDDWWVLRDPAGAMTADLTSVGAWDDGTIDVVEVTHGFIAGLRARGFTTTHETDLSGVGTNHVYLTPDDLGALVAVTLRDA